MRGVQSLKSGVNSVCLVSMGYGEALPVLFFPARFAWNFSMLLVESFPLWRSSHLSHAALSLLWVAALYIVSSLDPHRQHQGLCLQGVVQCFCQSPRHKMPIWSQSWRTSLLLGKIPFEGSPLPWCQPTNYGRGVLGFVSHMKVKQKRRSQGWDPRYVPSLCGAAWPLLCLSVPQGDLLAPTGSLYSLSEGLSKASLKIPT